ncbi:hypothetical protein KIPB_013759, partial [Kipferlia bialata]
AETQVAALLSRAGSRPDNRSRAAEAETERLKEKAAQNLIKVKALDKFLDKSGDDVYASIPKGRPGLTHVTLHELLKIHGFRGQVPTFASVCDSLSTRYPVQRAGKVLRRTVASKTHKASLSLSPPAPSSLAAPLPPPPAQPTDASPTCAPLPPLDPEDEDEGVSPCLDDRLSLIHSNPSQPVDSTRLTSLLSSPHAFMESSTPPSLLSKPVSAVLGPDSEAVPGRGLLGVRVRTSQDEGEREAEPPLLWLNTRDPFAAVVCGVQNSGKSHTLNSIVESCMLKCP